MTRGRDGGGGEWGRRDRREGRRKREGRGESLEGGSHMTIVAIISFYLKHHVVAMD